MAHEIVMPQLSLSMDKGKIVNWLKQSGDKIHAGDVLIEVESDKAMVEVETVESGILQIVLGPNDGEIAVGAVIAYTLAENEAPVVVSSASLPLKLAANEPEPEPVKVSPPGGSDLQLRRLPSSPAARRRAAELKIDWQQVKGTGRDGQIKERDVLRFSQEMEKAASLKTMPAAGLQLTPLARRVADNFGLDDLQLAKLIPGKTKVEREDVEEAVRQLVRERSSAVPVPVILASAGQKPAAAPGRQPMGAVRRRIAERMMLSQQTVAPVTLMTEVDATELVRIRETSKNDPHSPGAPSYNALLTKIVARALLEYPDLNSSLEGSEIVHWPTVNIGVAVDTERGLVVPVLQDVSAKSVSEIAREMNDLLNRAAQGKATVDDLTGGTFTITNLGIYDIDAFTPIINPPECAVLGVGRLNKKMVVINDQPAVRTMLVLSLTFDHRLVDGAPAARFLQRIRQFCEQPYLWLL